MNYNLEQRYGTGSPLKIHKSRWTELPQLFVDMGFKVGAEIGVLKGDFTETLCKAGLRIIGVDAWIGYDTYNDYTGEHLNSCEERARERLEGYDCELIKGWSSEVVKTIPDASLDFVFIDGNHAYEYVVEDIARWSKKVRKGGIVAGHDYFSPKGKNLMHVVQAVDGWVKSYDIKNFYVLTGDKCPSWLWQI